MNWWRARWERNHPSVFAAIVLLVVLREPGWFPIRLTQMPAVFGFMIGIATLIIGFAISGLAFLAGALNEPGMMIVREVGLFDRIVRYFRLCAGASLALVVVAIAGLVYSNYPHVRISVLESVVLAANILAILSFMRLFRGFLRLVVYMHKKAPMVHPERNDRVQKHA